MGAQTPLLGTQHDPRRHRIGGHSAQHVPCIMHCAGSDCHSSNAWNKEPHESVGDGTGIPTLLLFEMPRKLRGFGELKIIVNSCSHGVEADCLNLQSLPSLEFA